MQATATLDHAEPREVFTTRHAWLLAVAMIASGLFTQAKTLSNGYERNDFAHYYLSARILLSGENPYTVPLKPLCEKHGLEYDTRIPYGANPPMLIRALAAFAWMSPKVAFACWTLFQAGILILLLETTRRIVRWNIVQVQWWLFVGLVLSSTSLQSHVYYSQVQLFVAAVLVSALAFRMKGRHLLACGLAGFAAGFKIYPAVLLPWFVLFGAKDHKERLTRIGASTLGLCFVLALTGPAAWISFIQDGLPVLHSNSAVGSHTNYSLQAVLVNSLSGTLTLFGIQKAGAIAALIARVASPLVILSAYALIWRKKFSDLAVYCLLTIVMIACSPVAWTHYMVLMIPPVAIIFRGSIQIENIRIRYLAYFLAALVLMPELDGSLWGASDHVVAWIIHYYPLYALIALATLLVKYCPTLSSSLSNSADSSAPAKSSSQPQPA